MEFPPASQQPLLGASPARLHWPPLLCIAASGAGMMMLKRAERDMSVVYLALGYCLEGVAFLAYPVALGCTSMRLLTTSWAASSTLTAVIAGWAYFGEQPSAASLLGCGLVVTGVGMVAFS